MGSREVLEKAYMFPGATAADLEAVAALAQPVALAAGETVAAIGTPADAFWVIELGSVDLRMRGQETVLITVTSGQPFGDEAFFDANNRATRLGTARTREPTHLLQINYADLDRLLAARPSLALVVYRNAAAYYAHALRTLAGEISHRVF